MGRKYMYILSKKTLYITQKLNGLSFGVNIRAKLYGEKFCSSTGFEIYEFNGKKELYKKIKEFKPEIIIFDKFYLHIFSKKIKKENPNLKIFIIQKFFHFEKGKYHEFFGDYSAILMPYDFPKNIEEKKKHMVIPVGEFSRTGDIEKKKKLISELKINKDSYNILVMSGSGKFEITEKIINYAKDKYKNIKNVKIYICRGNSYCKKIHKNTKKYINLGIIEDINNIFSEMDLIISKAGYNTLSEISKTNTPAIVFPRENSDEILDSKYFSNKYKNIKILKEDELK